jgi:hypothetical protein
MMTMILHQSENKRECNEQTTSAIYSNRKKRATKGGAACNTIVIERSHAMD